MNELRKILTITDKILFNDHLLTINRKNFELLMAMLRALNKDKLKVIKFLDWDKYKNRFYNNLYLKDYKLVVKIPLIPQKNIEEEIKIKRFNLTKYTYLISYD